MRRALVIAGVGLLILGCPRSEAGRNRRIEVMVDGLADPWGIAFLPTGDLVCVTYDNSLVHQIRDLGLPTQTITTDPRVLTPSAIGVSTSGNFVPPCDTPSVIDLFDGTNINNPLVDRNTPAGALIENPTGICASGLDTDPWYVVDSNLGDLVQLDYNLLGNSSDNTRTTIATGIITRIPEAPTHLAWLGGMVYAADTGGDRLLAIDPVLMTTTTIAGRAEGLRRPAALTATAAGTLLVGNFGDGRIFEIDTSGVVIRTILTGLVRERLRAIAVDASGEIYIAHGEALRTNGKISRIKNP